ncbi:flagellar assembly peptidoglycan hydrolase FlgJ [Aliagarivorans taiwanensis]|uniref:flagellar assembly peptidoglycan hydrolase FlgJ n=1 Tax=Aliagarivorans taiwanensis TaxID=561966 RepID=UPI00041CF295|nr:flagellar assembly peptidoglycan hydrolase FlgJ [Aliagarivorans taiwanensis]
MVMRPLENTAGSNYHDIASLDELRSAAQKDEKKALQQVAGKFEGMFMQMLLKQMRQANAMFETDSPLNNRHTQTYRDMYDNQLATELSSSGALGLADLIVAQLDPDSSDIKPAAYVRGDELHYLTQRARAEKQFVPATEIVGTNTEYSTVLATQAAENQTKTTNIASADGNPAEVGKAEGQQFASPEEFISKMMPLVEKWAPRHGLDPAVVVAQAALESGWGQRVMAKGDGSSSFNLFGIKADRRWDGDKAIVSTLEYRGGEARRETASFRAYGSFEESVRDYLKFVQSPRYQQALANAGDGERYAEELQAAGYATDPQYANKIISIMNGRYFQSFGSASDNVE